jgi:hypothetical protein
MQPVDSVLVPNISAENVFDAGDGDGDADKDKGQDGEPEQGGKDTPLRIA